MTLRSRIAGSPVLWMLAAVAGFASLPVLIWAGTRELSPWLFVALWYVARAAVWTGLAQTGVPKTKQRLKDREADMKAGRVAMAADFKVIKFEYLVVQAFSGFSWLLFAIAVTLSDPSVVTVAFEFWPVLFALFTLTSFWDKRGLKESENQQGREAPASRIRMMLVMLVLDRSPAHQSLLPPASRIRMMLVMLVVGAAGVALVVVSENEGGLSAWTQRAWLGLLLAVVAAASTAAASINAQLMGSDQRPESSNRDRSSVSVSGNIVATLVVAPVIFIAGLLASAGSGWGFTASGLMFVVCAGLVYPISDWCFHNALHLARDRYKHESAGVNSIYYLTPVAALLLLAGFADTDIARPDLLIAGAAGVVAVNMVLHLDPEGAATRQGQGGYGYRALVLALWVSGVLILFRDDWVPDNWQVWSVVEYWGILGLLATVFILVYSFRQIRVEALRRDADELMLGLHHEFNVMRLYSEAQGVVDPTRHMSATECRKCMERLRVIDSDSGRNFNEDYLELRRDLESRTVTAVNAADTAEAQRWSKLLVDVERLVGMRQQGRGFAEPAVLAMFAAVTAALAVVARPENTLEPFARWVHDSVSVTIAAAFLFLGFDLVDKRRAADTPVFRKVGKTAQTKHGQLPGWRLELLSYDDRRVPQLITAALGAVLLIGAIAMLGFKWMT